MAERRRENYYRYQQQQQQQPLITTTGTTQSQTVKVNPSPSTSQVIVIATLVPLGATLLILAGLTLTATVIGLAVTTPLFVICSPVLLAAALVIGLSVAGFLTSGAFGVTSLSSFAWLASYLRRSRLTEQLRQQYAKPRLEDTVGQDTVVNEAQMTEEARDREGKAQEMVQEAQSDARKAGKAQKETRTSITS